MSVPDSLARAVLACLVVCAATPLVGATAPNATDADRHAPRIVGAVPKPVADGDAGEFVVVRLPDAGNWSLADGEDTLSLPSDRPAAVVAVSADPNATRELVSVPVVAVPGLALSNAGERLRLRRDGTVVDTLVYRDAPEGERLVRTDAGTAWRPVGLSPRDVHAFGHATVRGFLLPDDPGVAVETIRSADERILLAGYTFTSERVADALLAADRRGLDVRVLLESTPVGGLSAREARLLDRLVAGGVAVTVLGGPRARFAFHHAKYAVVDDRALVTTENWKPAGVGGRSSRGWGVVVDSSPVAADLASLFAHDAAGPDAIPWAHYRRGRAFDAAPPAKGSYPSRFDPTAASARRVRVLTAPGNAESAVVGVVDAADDRVDVIQPTIDRRHGPLLRATVRAAERGVRVRILLSGAWYDAEENRALVDSLDRLADRRDLPLSARVADPHGRFEKIHAKGVVADDVVVVGSLNWTENAVSNNREVALAVRSEALASYFRRAFESDWSGGSGPGWVLVAGAVAAILLAGLVARRTLSFDGDAPGRRR
ncbi:MAG: phospholipase D-like domain-containing protein [Haloplanus sp.]